jgi:hypothetical protein
VERAPLEIDISEMMIDEAKSAYIATKGVNFADVLEVLALRPRFFVSVTERGTRYAMLGPNRTGRFLLVAIGHVEAGVWRVITAYWLRAARGRRLYGED